MGEWEEEELSRKNSQDKSKGIRKNSGEINRMGGGCAARIIKGFISHVVLVVHFKAASLPHLLILGRKKGADVSQSPGHDWVSVIGYGAFPVNAVSLTKSRL